MVKSRFAILVIYAALGIFLLATLFPVLWVLLLSVSPESEIFSEEMRIIPRQVTGDYYRAIFTEISDFGIYFRNSCIFVSVSLLFIVLVSSMSGFALRRNIPGSMALLAAFVVFMAIPLTLYYVPLYQMVSACGLYDTWAAIIIPSVGFAIPFSTFIMRAAFRTIPAELEEAAVIDGVNPWQLFVKVMWPLAGSGVIIVVVFNFLSLWSEFFLMLVMTQSTNIQTLPVGMLALRDELGAGARSVGLVSAGIVVSILPTIVLYIALQRHFVKGIASGALKG